MKIFKVEFTCVGSFFSKMYWLNWVNMFKASFGIVCKCFGKVHILKALFTLVIMLIYVVFIGIPFSIIGFAPAPK